MPDDNLEKENEKIIIEKINPSVVSLKELIRGTGNIIMFGFFVAFPLFSVALALFMNPPRTPVTSVVG